MDPFIARGPPTNFGVLVPINLPSIRPPANKAQAVTPAGYGPLTMGLMEYCRMQLMASRQKYFIIHEMYRRDTWIRSTIDYIVRRLTRDPNRLVDRTDPMNPAVRQLQTWLDDCFPDGDFEDLYGSVAQDLLEYHQAYLFIERNRRGRPIHLWPLDSRICFPVIDFSGAILFHAQVYNGQAQFFTSDDVLYFSGRNNGADPRGIPSMETLYESVAMELQANRYNARLFENNLNIGAVFSMPNADVDQVEETRRYLVDQYSGSQNAYSPLIISGEAKMLRDGAMRVKDINFELLIRVARHRVSAVFGVPESLLGIPDNTNRRTSNTHERTTYTNTILPMRRRINRRFTSQFIRRSWGTPELAMVEPLNSMLPTAEEIDAANKVAEMGILFNDYLEMTGRERVPNGDYWIIKTPNGLVRLDVETMPGIGDPHFDFVAYQIQHQAESQRAEAMTMAGVQGGRAGRFVPPRPQDQLQLEPVAARIIDLSRSMEESWTIARRNPTNPGSRGGRTLYTTKNGTSRYGTRPKGTAAPAAAGDGAGPVNPQDIPAAPTISPEDRLAVARAQSEVEVLFTQRQLAGWDQQTFFAALQEKGWQLAQGTAQSFPDTATVRREARRLTEEDSSSVFTILGSDGNYQIFQRPMSVSNDKIAEATGTRPKAQEDTGNPSRMRREQTDTGNPTAAPKSGQDTGNPVARPAGDNGVGKVKRRISDWKRDLEIFIQVSPV